ncbi:P-loop NTPase [Skermanella mucosa]|uniref:P-loop NTPase n=1 Tax=Skermanella mucosa TaxID=1789672 RepID=UPI00192C056B|nr:P-loop NTPase [Skermanella mucosa]UEM20085.1 P-loop NTPase [Skermanella mucosa]
MGYQEKLQQGKATNMDLIHRAVQQSSAARRGNIVESPGTEPVAGPAPRLAPAAPPPWEASEAVEITIDPARLREMGMINPGDRRSRLAEEMRLLKRRLIQKLNPMEAEAEGRTNLVMVTSAVPGEGKSFISLNLALSFVADEHFDVLLIDADAMRPSILRMLGLPPSRGLSDLLLEPGLDPSEVLLRDRRMRLTILPSGGEVPSATDLYSSPAMKELIDRLARSQRNRIVILDAPPVLATTEPVVLSHIVDQVLLVVEANRTAHSQVQHALDLLEPCDNVNLILNKSAAGKTSEHFGSYYGGYEKGRYGRRGHGKSGDSAAAEEKA